MAAGGVASIVTVSAAEAGLACPSSSCVAVKFTEPSASETVPLVVISALVPLAVAWPTRLPLANSLTSAPLVTPLTRTWSDCDGALLFSRVRLSALSKPVSLAASRSRPVGAAGGCALVEPAAARSNCLSVL
jgi:hypothetical protein